MSDELKGTIAIAGGVALLCFIGTHGIAMTLVIAMMIPVLCIAAIMSPFSLYCLFWAFLFKNVFNNNNN